MHVCDRSSDKAPESSEDASGLVIASELTSTMDGSDDRDDTGPTLEEVEERFDFESFGPADLAEMTPEEWDVAFDPDSWITGHRLLERVETDLRRRIAERDVFAVVEWTRSGGEECLLAYSDEGYALVRPNGSVEGFGTVLNDVKPSVALCSMPEYEPEEAPPGLGELPDPAEVEQARGRLGNLMLQAISFAMAVCGLILLAAWLAYDLPLFAAVIALGFLVVAALLVFLVINARLSSRYRAEDYRERLRAAGVGSDDRPSFLPDADESEEESPGQA